MLFSFKKKELAQTKEYKKYDDKICVRIDEKTYKFLKQTTRSVTGLIRNLMNLDYKGEYWGDTVFTPKRQERVLKMFSQQELTDMDRGTWSEPKDKMITIYLYKQDKNLFIKRYGCLSNYINDLLHRFILSLVEV